MTVSPTWSVMVAADAEPASASARHNPNRLDRRRRSIVPPSRCREDTVASLTLQRACHGLRGRKPNRIAGLVAPAGGRRERGFLAPRKLFSVGRIRPSGDRKSVV